MNVLLAATLIFSSAFTPVANDDGPGLPTELTRGWAILAAGRVKPLDTFATETVIAITGKPTFDGLSALDIIWGYHLASESFRTREYVRIDSLELKARLDLDPAKKRFAFNTLMDNPEFRTVVERAISRQKADAELTRIERDALETYNRLELIADIVSGAALRIVPVPDSERNWATPVDLKGASNAAHRAVYGTFAALATAYGAGDAHGFRAAALKLGPALSSVHPGAYPTESDLRRELFYNDLNAFGKAWVVYLLSFLVVLFSGIGKRKWAYISGLALLLLGFAAHTTGLGLRWVVAARAPVSDMYESLVFMGWGAIAIGLLLEAVYRKRYFALVAGLMGFLSLMFAERLPLDSSINPLVPVLAHTSWLSIHVMTIMLSYSAFALTMAFGHVVIAIQLFRPGKTEQLRTLSSLLYKALQVGLLFLAAGIVFGAIWANESWGRYWGWDPKETWSLITFFVYLAIVHGRFAGWLHNFGLAVSAIVGFLSVLMTYYGVNFVLGAGLHSYGFASGGLVWVLLFLALEIGIIAAATVRYRIAIRRGWIARSALA